MRGPALDDFRGRPPGPSPSGALWEKGARGEGDALSHRKREAAKGRRVRVWGATISIAPAVLWPDAFAIMGGLLVATALTLPTLSVAWLHGREPKGGRPTPWTIRSVEIDRVFPRLATP